MQGKGAKERSQESGARIQENSIALRGSRPLLVLDSSNATFIERLPGGIRHTPSRFRVEEGVGEKEQEPITARDAI
jgi:hypothetical protein